MAVLLLAVVALASRGFGEAGRGGQIAPAPAEQGASGGVAGALVVLAVVGAIAATTVVAIALKGLARPRKRPDEMVGEPPRRPWWSGPLLILMVLATFALPIGLLVWISRIGGQSQPPAGSAGHAAQRVAPGHAGGLPEPTSPDWALVGVAIGIVVVVLLILTRGRRRPPALTLSSRREEMAQAVEESIEDIDGDPDPRHAIISAYARMERVLAAHGWARRPSRAPFEYLEESLQQLSVPAAPARSLTELFELAKFSRHRMDTSMKRRAIDALVAVRQALEEGS
ncbi:MAG: DUF4129 domain-containing protein [Actinomycetota bacterium]|nr:DUF4129 domain-containing protein [Actinomycetota bacterium]